MDEALCPLDYAKAGVLRDDDVLKTLIAPMQRGVTLTCIMDCCHSGTILDLPFIFLADGMQQQMQADPDFDFGAISSLVGAFAEVGLEGLKKIGKRAKKRSKWLKNRLGL